MPDPAQPQIPQPPPQPARTIPPNLPPMEMVRLANMLHALSHDPQTRPIIAEAMFKKDPQFAAKAFQDVALDRRFKSLEDKIAQKELDKQVSDAVASQTRDKQKLIEGGRTADEVADIEKLMVARNYHSYNDAAILYDAEKPQVPVTYEANSATWEFPTVPTRDGKASVPFKDFQKDSRSAAYNAAYRVIDDFKLNTLPRSFSR